MEDSGYSTNQDPRLQPQLEIEISEGQRMYESCVHALACVNQHSRISPIYGDTWEELGCDGCSVFDDQLCPLRLAGTMRCERSDAWHS